MLQFYPQLDFVKARELLANNNWDLNQANLSYIESQSTTVKLIDKSTGVQLSDQKFNQE